MAADELCCMSTCFVDLYRRSHTSLYKNSAVTPWRRSDFAAGPPTAACAKPTFCSKTLHSGLLAAQTASGRACWRPRRPPDTGQFSWRLRRPPDRPPGAKRAFDAYAFLSVLQRLHDDFLYETSVRSTRLQMNFAACRLASSIYIDGVTLV